MSEEESKYVAFITEQNVSFTMKAIIKCLEDDKYKVDSYNICEIGKATSQTLPPITIIQAEAFIDLAGTVKNKLYNSIVEQDKALVILGYPTEIEQLKATVPKANLIGTLVRPFDNSELPQKMEALQSALKKREGANKPDNDAEKKNILVVDDSGVMLRTIMGWLEPKFNVALANCAAAALTSIRRSKPDLILLDYEMPMYSGAQLLEMIRNDAESSDIPVIFLTSKGDANTVQEVLALKPQGYMLKTTPPNQIIQRIDEYFAH